MELNLAVSTVVRKRHIITRIANYLYAYQLPHWELYLCCTDLGKCRV
jgi:hypothetical protein